MNTDRDGSEIRTKQAQKSFSDPFPPVQICGSRFRQAKAHRTSFPHGFQQQLRNIHDPNVSITLAGVDAVFHHGHAKRTTNSEHVCSGLDHFASAFLVHSFVRRLVDEAHSAATATAKTLLAISL